VIDPVQVRQQWIVIDSPAELIVRQRKDDNHAACHQ
jgi:hypothetical protein